MKKKLKSSGGKGISYAKWGYIFILPFFIAYTCFTLIPQLMTFYNSLFENYRDGLTQIGPNFVGLKNYVKLFSPDNSGNIGMLKYFGNTLVLWLLGAVPQILVALLLAVFFTSYRLNLKDQQFFKTVIYMPNLIMAAAFSMLFFTLFSKGGPVNSILVAVGVFKEPYDFMAHIGSVRGLVGFMNCLMWFGNTTILLMAGMMGIPDSLYEAAEVDGATPGQIFWKVTMPLLKPIFVYVLVTSLIGGLQMFDVPQILTNGSGDPMRTSMTLIMYLNKHLFSKNFGMAGALSVLLLILTGFLSAIVFQVTAKDEVQ